MAEERRVDFRQQAVTTANMLLEAASLLENPSSNATSSSAASSNRPLRNRLSLRASSSRHVQATSSRNTWQPSSSFDGMAFSDSRSASTTDSQSELRSLFNWTAPTGGKRKASHRSASGPFRKKSKAKRTTWTHTWVCLSGVAHDTVPDANDRVTLKLAGLGEKRFALEANATAQEVYDELVFQYPKLKDAGGFELLRTCESGSRELEVIRMPDSGYTTDYLKAVIHTAKLYIRPLQSDLWEEPSKADDITDQVPEEVCKRCHRLVPVSEIKKHLGSCFKDREDFTEDSGTTPESPTADDLDDQPILLDLSVNNKSIKDVSDTDDAMLQYVIEASKQTNQPDVPPGSLAEVLQSLTSNVGAEFFTMVVRRSDLLEDAITRARSKHFSPSKTIVVEFAGEDGSDTGGLRREFFCLLKRGMAGSYLNCTGGFQHNSLALQKGVYRLLGELIAVSVVQGGSGPHLFSASVYQYLCGQEVSTIAPQITEIPDREVRDTLEQVMCATDAETLRTVAFDNAALFLDSGLTVALSLVKMEDKETMIKTVALHQVLLKSKAEADQFSSGLKALGVLDSVRENPHLFKSYFMLNGDAPMTAEMMRKLFRTVQYSDMGTNSRVKEEQTYMHFVNFLEDCEDGYILKNKDEEEDEDNEKYTVTLAKVLSFFTGAEEVPPLGFPHDPTLFFSKDNLYPTASTCAIQLTLPLQYESYVEFRKAVAYAMLNHGGFALC